MDLSSLDNLITVLEKKRSARPGSPPVVLNGHLGVWRTVRQHRVFIETKSGKVLVGPPSFVGKPLSGIDDETWAAMTPRATQKEFSQVDVADNGLETLRNSIKNAVAPNDSRREDVDDLDSVMQLVPVARSAGFTDEEIKSALKGDAPNEPLDAADRKNVTEEIDSVEQVDDATEGKKPSEVKPAKDPKEEFERAQDEIKEPEKPKTPSAPKGKGPTEIIEGALAVMAESPPKGQDRENFVGKFLDKVADRIDDEVFKKQVQKLAYGLQSGDYTLVQVKDRLQEIARSRDAAKRNQPTKEQLDALADRADLKEMIDNFDKKLEEKVDEAIERVGDRFKPAESAQPAQKPEISESQKQKMELDAAIALLKELQQQLKSPEAKKEVKEVIESVSVNPFSRRSILLRLYQLLQLLLMFIPLP